MGISEEILARKLFPKNQPVFYKNFKNWMARVHDVDSNLTNQLIDELSRDGFVEVEQKGFKRVIKPRL